MTPLNIIDAGLAARLDPNVLTPLRLPCLPRVLVVADGILNFRANDSFGLWRFLHGITTVSGVINKPTLTLVHHGAHIPTVTIGSDAYTVKTSFNFSTATPTVTLANCSDLQS